jgi:small subunit ribosomal protein S20
MANNPSTEKRIRQNQIRRERNRSAKAEMRKSVKRLRAALEAGDAKTAEELLPETLSVVDSSVRKSAIHRNTADRTKSRLVRAVQALSDSS